jgi:hypothetical protein
MSTRTTNMVVIGGAILNARSLSCHLANMISNRLKPAFSINSMLSQLVLPRISTKAPDFVGKPGYYYLGIYDCRHWSSDALKWCTKLGKRQKQCK